MTADEYAKSVKRLDGLVEEMTRVLKVFGFDADPLEWAAPCGYPEPHAPHFYFLPAADCEHGYCVGLADVESPFGSAP